MSRPAPATAPSARPPRRWRRGATLLACLVALASCSQSAGVPPGSPGTGSGSAEARTSAPADPLAELRGGRYVALGDSFTAAPLVPLTDVADGCFRSDGNYPSLLAASLGMRLRDVSCSGAATRHLVRRQPTVRGATVRPQLRAVDERAALVTLGIGGNDRGLFARLVRACLDARRLDPTGSPCAESAVGRRMATAVPAIGSRVERAARRVVRAAPDARVVLVGYPRIAPSEGRCPRRLPLADGDVAFADRLLRRLDRAMRRAAARAGVDYLDLYAASAGHDVCSAEPWVNGRRTRTGVALAFHPLAAGTRATAAELETLLASG